MFCVLLAPSVRSDLEQEQEREAELVAAVRQIVAERFSGNPAYQLLKARFLSCFTVPALLATIQPVRDETATQDEEEAELKKTEERGRQSRAQVSICWRFGFYSYSLLWIKPMARQHL